MRDTRTSIAAPEHTSGPHDAKPERHIMLAMSRSKPEEAETAGDTEEGKHDCETCIQRSGVDSILRHVASPFIAFPSARPNGRELTGADPRTPRSITLARRQPAGPRPV